MVSTAPPDVQTLLAELSVSHAASLTPLHTILNALSVQIHTLATRVDQLTISHNSLLSRINLQPTECIPEKELQGSPDDLTQPPSSPPPQQQEPQRKQPSTLTLGNTKNKEINSNIPKPSPTSEPSPPSQPQPQPPTSAKTPRPTSKNNSSIPSSSSTRLKRPRRRSRRTPLSLKVLYLDNEDEENNNTNTTNTPAKKQRHSPDNENHKSRPLSDLTNTKHNKDNSTPPAPITFEGFRTPAAAAQAAFAIQNAAQARATPKCKEVIRGNRRASLQAAACPECEDFLRKEAQGRHDPDLAYSRLVNNACRHRQKFLPPDTPDDFWKLTFEETQTQPPPPQPGKDGKNP